MELLVIDVRHQAKDAVVLLPLRQFHHQNNPTASFSLAPTGPWTALKVFNFFTSYFTEYSLTVSPTAEKLPPPKFIPINIWPRNSNLLFASSYSSTISEPSTTSLIHWDLNWVSILNRWNIFYYLQWIWVSHFCVCRVWRGFFRFFPRQELHRTQQRGNNVGCGECRHQLPHNHFEVRNSVLESA